MVELANWIERSGEVSSWIDAILSEFMTLKGRKLTAKKIGPDLIELVLSQA